MAPESLAEVRRFVDEALAGTAGAAVRESARLVATELASNAVRHAVAVSFDVSVDVESTVRVAVEDADDRPVEPREPAEGDTEGRGLQIVARLCDRWGIDDLEPGKRVWCELGANPGAPAAPDSSTTD